MSEFLISPKHENFFDLVTSIAVAYSKLPGNKMSFISEYYIIGNLHVYGKPGLPPDEAILFDNDNNVLDGFVVISRDSVLFSEKTISELLSV